MYVFDVKIDNLTIKETLDKIRVFLGDGKQHYIVLPYSEFIVRAQKNEEFKKILNKADLSLCEAKGLYFTLKFLGLPIKEEINGVELIYNICSNSQSNRKSPIFNSKIFLLGGTNEVVKKTKEKLGNNIIGAENGYQDLNRVVDKINKAKPEILMVGLGSPRQEKWIYNNIKKIPNVKVVIGVGGAFDFISGRVKRAPSFMQRTGTEWIWRLIIQPKRLKRISRGVGGLMRLALKERIKSLTE